MAARELHCAIVRKASRMVTPDRVPDLDDIPVALRYG